MPELLDVKSNYLKPGQKDTYVLANAIDIPDRAQDKML